MRDKNKLLTVRISQDTLEAAKRKAEQERKPISKVVRKSLEDWIKDDKAKQGER